jgi:peptidylprolyl isomerase
MRGKNLIIVLFAITAGLVSCNKEDDSEQIALEDRVFEAYLQNNDITAEPRESGLYFIEETDGTGMSPTEGDWVLVKYDLYLINGETLIYTSDREKASDFGIFDERIIYGPSKTKVGENLEGFDEGLMLMKEGGKATLLFKSDLGYGDQTAGRITPYSSLRIDMELITVIENPITYEEELITDYLEKNNFTDVKPTSSGLYFINIEEGTGDSAQNNFFVTINVDGFLIDGRRFLDEEVFRFRLGDYDYALTDGLTEGVGYMKEQGKAKLIVPFNIGYGVVGKSYFEGKAKVPIPPYTTLIYDVELLNAK